MRTKIVSSLEKCFLTDKIDKFTEITEEKIFKNQKYSFQVIIASEEITEKYGKVEISPIIESQINDYLTVEEIVPVPCEIPDINTSDEWVDNTAPGLYPDLLRPLKYNGTMRFHPGHARSLLITVDPRDELAGEYSVKVKVFRAAYDKGLKATEELLSECCIKIKIADASLAPLKISPYFTESYMNFTGIDDLARPFQRTRFLGTQLFKYNMLDLYNRIPTAMTYPDRDGKTFSSMRLNAFNEGISDATAMENCLRFYSHNEIVRAMEEIAGEIKLSGGVYSVDTVMAIRRKINEMIFDKI